MKITNIKNNIGFTLLEVLVATTMVVLVSTLTLGLFETGYRLFKWNVARFDAEDALIQLGRDLRQGTNVTINTDGSLTFLSKEDTITYELTPASGGLSYLKKTVNGEESKPITSYINSLKFEILPKDRHLKLIVYAIYQKLVVGDVPKTEDLKQVITLRNSVKVL